MRRWAWLLMMMLAAACSRGPESAREAGGGDAAADGDRSVQSYRRFVLYRDADRAMMLLDARTGRTWYRAGDTATVWRPFRVQLPDTARNYSPLRGLRRDTTRADDDDDDGGAILLRFEIHDERTPLPVLLDRRSGRSWFRELRADGPWWIPFQVVPADTTGNYAPLQTVRASAPR